MARNLDQDALFDTEPLRAMPKQTTTFANNMTLPIHRWFRYSAGYSSVWAQDVIEKARADRGEGMLVLDPFLGSGTTMLAAQSAGVSSYGIESHPFVVRVARAKLAWSSSVEEFEHRVAAVIEAHETKDLPDGLPALLGKCFSDPALETLFALRDAVAVLSDGSDADRLTWLALVGIIRASSHVGTAQWQYVLPNKTKARVAEPLEAFCAICSLIASDMRTMQRENPKPPPATLVQTDARTCEGIGKRTVDLVLTSPPYANNYDYADATRLEQTVLGEVRGWADLTPIRDTLIRSCSQHMVGFDGEEALANAELDPIRDELTAAVRQLTAEKSTHGGKKAYDHMAIAYFGDQAKVWNSLRRVCKPGAIACFVVGDSAPYGVKLHVEKWIGELALAAGFKSWSFEKTRDRNVKWENRKHRVPLVEGRLWVQG